MFPSILRWCLVLLASVVLGQGAEPEFPLVAAQECRPRQGLPNFFAKAQRSGAELKVAYLGGSITAQPGWRVKSLAHLAATFPQAKFSEIHAAIGGTGSDLGVFRLQQDVLAKKPDLLWVEFAVNDGGAQPEEIFRCMEGIVRQTWRALPECDICFVYTVTEALVPPMLKDHFPRAASAMERVAEHYGIPSIHMGMEVAKLAKEGKLVWKAPLPKTPEEKAAAGDKFIFAPDSVHPHVETGHELYLQAIARSLPLIQKASGAAQAHTLPAPMVADNYEQAKLLPISAATLSPGFTKLEPAQDALAKRFANFKTLYRGAPGETIRFKFKGTRCGIYYVTGPDTGKVAVTLDGKRTERTCFDSYGVSHRPTTMLLGTGLPDTEHTVEIEVLSDAPDKAKILASRQQTMDKPERFAGLNFYPGAILLVGELVK